MKSSSFAVLSVAIVGLVGCGSASNEANPADLQAYNKIKHIDPDKVNKFLNDLEATPAGSRRDFVNQHPQDMVALGETRDPAVQARFQQIVRGSK